MSLELVFDAKSVREAFDRSPRIFAKHLNRATNRAAQEMARTARSLAPKAHTVLTNSIRPRSPDALTGEVVAGTDYARLVEEGTGPGGYPPQQTMLDWIKVNQIQPREPDMTQEDLAFVIARDIALHGTLAQPFMAPAFESKKARAEQLIGQAIDAALQEIGR